MSNILKSISCFCKLHIIIDLETWGFGVTVFKNAEISNYRISLDIQILCINIWVKLFKKKSNEVNKSTDKALILSVVNVALPKCTNCGKLMQLAAFQCKCGVVKEA